MVREHQSVSIQLPTAQRFSIQSVHGFQFRKRYSDQRRTLLFSKNSVPYTENYILSIQRQLRSNALLTISYVGNQGHHILVTVPTNTANQALCLSLSHTSQVAPTSSTGGPFGENSRYTSALARCMTARERFWDTNYGAVTANRIGNSNYNALQANLRLIINKDSTVYLGYTYSKSIDDGSNLGEQMDGSNDRLTRAVSSFDMTHNFVATYHYALPFDRVFRRNRFTDGWSLSGTTRFSTGFPVTLSDTSDRSLLGTLGNGFNNQLLDTPQLAAGPLQINTNPRNGLPAFNTGPFPRKRWECWETRPGVSSMDPALKTSTWR